MDDIVNRIGGACACEVGKEHDVHCDVRRRIEMDRRPSAREVNAFLRGDAPMPQNMRGCDLPPPFMGGGLDVLKAFFPDIPHR